MRNKKAEKTAYLFREMGGIDDYLLQEALIYRPARKRSPRLLLVAACLCLSFLLVFGSVLIAMRGKQKEDMSDIPDDNPNEAVKTSDLDSMLLDCRDNASYTTLGSAEELDLFSSPCVVWQYADSEELYVSRALTQSEVTALTRNMGKGQEVGAASPSLSCLVWVVPGNGTVLSPYLKSSAGNVGYELFDYEAELLPSESFTSCLSDILY